MAITKFFDFLNIFFEKKAIPSIEDINKHCNQFMLNTTFSCDPQLVEIAHQMSKLKISNKMYFDCMYYGLPKMKRYIPYNATKVKSNENITYIMRHFNCNRDIANQYINLISETEMKEIVEIYENRGLK